MFPILRLGADAVAPPETTATIPIRDFFRPPFVNLPLVNPAGNRLVALYATEDDKTGALLFDLESRKSRRLLPIGDRDIDEISWLGDDHVMWVQSLEKLYADAIYVAEFERPERAYAIERKNAVEVVGVPLKNSLRPIVWIRQDAYNEGKDYGVVQLDAKTSVDPERNRKFAETRITKIDETALSLYGTEANIARNYPDQKLGRTLYYLVDKHEELAFSVATLDGRKHLLLLEDKKWSPSPIDLEQYSILGAGEEPDEVLALGPRQEGKPRAILRIDARTGSTVAILYQDEAYDPVVVSIKRHPVTRTLVGLQLYRKSLETVWFDSVFQELQPRLNKLFPGRIVSVIASDATVRRIVLAVFSDRHPVAYHFLDLNKNEIQLIADSAPWIDPTRMRPMQNLSYKTRDGKRVEGFLTLPDQANKNTPPPLVVLVHGGPWARDSWQWNSEVQFLASRGYAVFQPNYRGSTGFNWRFAPGDNWEFRKMHDDVTDGVRQLIKSGVIDSKRIAIMGSSFGGYLAMCGAVYEPELYRCAITEAGVFDWTLMMKDAKRDRFESARYEIYLRNLGDPKNSAEAFENISPLNHVDRIKIPLLVAHGKKDAVVSIEQSKRLVEELKRHHIPHQVMFKKGEGHGISHLGNMVDYYTAVEAFLAGQLLLTP